MLNGIPHITPGIIRILDSLTELPDGLLAGIHQLQRSSGRNVTPGILQQPVYFRAQPAGVAVIDNPALSSGMRLDERMDQGLKVFPPGIPDEMSVFGKKVNADLVVPLGKKLQQLAQFFFR